MSHAPPRLPAKEATSVPTRYDLTYVPLGSAGWGGAERSLLDLADRTARQGKRVLLLAEQALKASPFEEVARARNLDIRWVDWAPHQSLRHNLRAAQAAFRNLDSALIHFNISWRDGMSLIPVLARMLTRSRLIGSMRALPDPADQTPRKRHLGGLIPGLRLWTIPDRIRGMLWARSLHLAVSVNRDDYPKRMIDTFGFRPERIRVVYNGVEIPARLPDKNAYTEIRKTYHYSADDFVVCYFGRISAEKGVRYLLEALVGQPPSVRLLVIGEGPEEAALRETARQLGVFERVTFAGFLAQPEVVVAACDLVAVPSIWHEAFGRTVVEALAHEVPVVASRIGGMAELFNHGEHGLYVPPADSAALCQAIGSLAVDRARARQMGARGRDWVMSRFTMERVARDYNALYDELLPPRTTAPQRNRA